MNLYHLAFSNLVVHFDELFSEPLFFLYFSLVITDLVLGNVKAWTTNTVNSDIGIKGTMKHGAVLVFVILVLPPLAYYLDSSATSVVILSYLAYQYAISIIENLSALGYDMPDSIMDKIPKTRSENERKDKE